MKGLSTKALTTSLRALSGQAIDIEPDGTPITRYEKLAKLIWDQALGYTEKVRDDEGNLKEIVHKPVAWAQQYVFERLEGKAIMAVAEEDGRIKAAEKVRDLAKDRINKLAGKMAGVKSGPPRYKPQEKP